jgi:hypothetical protein
VKKNKLQKNSTKIELKIKEITGWNKARVFIVVGLIISIIRAGSVSLKKIARKINPEESKEVNYRRLSRFFQKFHFEKKIMAKLMSSFLPDEKWVLTMDRTNWKFGKTHINILMLAVAYKGMAIPIIWTLLPKNRKNGNSNFRDRIRIIKKRKVPFAIKLKDEYLILATNIKQEKALGYYKRRWEIETLFSAYKI